MKTAGQSTINFSKRQALGGSHPLDTVKLLPQRPGVYRFYNKNGKIIYIGKAKNLKNRVSSYFHKGAALAPDKKRMVAQIAAMEWLVVNNENEAWLLEATLIKQFLPKYNIILKDDSNFLFIKIAAREIMPTISLVRKRDEARAQYFGPYANSQNVRQFLKSVKTFLPIKTCANKPSKPCFEARIGRCAGHDLSPTGRGTYRQIVKNFESVCRGQTEDLAKYFENKMRVFASVQNFELAKKYRDNLRYLKIFAARQLVIASPRENTDVWTVVKTENGALAARLVIRGGKLIDFNNLKLAQIFGQQETEIYRSLLALFYANEPNPPKQIICTILLEAKDKKSLEKLFKTKIVSPRTGRAKKLLALTLANALEAELRQRPSWLKTENNAAALQKFLGLKTPPRRLECYDISNLSGKHPVGSLAVFINGTADKKSYRHFAVSGFANQNDTAMISQILNRRLNHPEWPYPDLIILDGGRGQLSLAEKNWPKNLEKIPMIALAKKMEEIYLPQGKLRLDRRHPALKLLQRLRDEAHRFALTFNRHKRLKIYKKGNGH